MRFERRWTALVAGLAVVTAVPALALLAAVPSTADTAPARGIPATVTADALPTVQVDGVVWSQAVIGTTVYAGGNFTTARPAGAAPGTRTVPRTHLLAFDIRTGKLVTRFAPTLNGQVTAVAAAADGKRVYVGGSFTRVNGVRRYRMAAFDTATGALISTFRPAFDSTVRALAVRAGTVYAGGSFTAVNGVARRRLAAVTTRAGALTPWAPAADDAVLSMVRTPDGTAVVVGGRFTRLAGVAALGLGAVDAVRGRSRPFAANKVIKDGGPTAGITSLTTDGRLVYGTGFAFGGGNFEGTFAANPATGKIVWLEDCHGDTYSAAVSGGAVYTAGHAHSCANIGGFPEASPRRHWRALAFSTAVAGTVAENTEGRYASFAGQPAPRLLTWWPELSAGSFTGQTQAAWNVVATKDYVVFGGEFPYVNGRRQQGLVRFATRALAPNRQGPVASADELALAATPAAAGEVRLTWSRTWDRDNERLTYTVTRDGLAAPVLTRAVATRFWQLGTMTATETGLAPGTYTYRLAVTDPLGNTVRSTPVTVTVG